MCFITSDITVLQQINQMTKLLVYVFISDAMRIYHFFCGALLLGGFIREFCLGQLKYCRDFTCMRLEHKPLPPAFTDLSAVTGEPAGWCVSRVWSAHSSVMREYWWGQPADSWVSRVLAEDYQLFHLLVSWWVYPGMPGSPGQSPRWSPPQSLCHLSLSLFPNSLCDAGRL